MTQYIGNVPESAKQEVISVGANNYYGRKNIIHNSDGYINQREFSSVAAVIYTGSYWADRMPFYIDHNCATDPTFSRSTDVPSIAQAGRKIEASGKILVNAVDSTPSGANEALFFHDIEGYNLAPHLSGDITVEFWVKTNAPGTYQFILNNYDGSSQWIAPCVINASGVWEKKTYTVDLSVGAATGNGIKTDNGRALRVALFPMISTAHATGTHNAWNASGSGWRLGTEDNLFDTVGNYMNFTGLRIWGGTEDCEPEVFNYGEELQLCQRYYYRRTAYDSANERLAGGGICQTATAGQVTVEFPVEMRAPPVLTYGTLANMNVYNGAVNAVVTGLSAAERGKHIFNIGWAATSGTFTPGHSCMITRNLNTADVWVGFDCDWFS